MSLQKTLSIQHPIRVRFNETDALGIVWHGNYLKYFEDGREAFGRHFNISYLDAKNNGFATPIVKTTTDHKLPLKYGDIATIETTFINSRAAKMVFKYIIRNEDGHIVCTGETTQVFTDLKTETLSFIVPDFFKNWQEKQGLLDE